jgi:hypothetical protein
MSKVQLVVLTLATLLVAGGGGLIAAGRIRDLAGPSATVKTGVWGATGIKLEVTESGGTVEYDCGHDTIDRPLAMDNRGRFSAMGLHYREGGPTRNDEQGEPARYGGTVNGDTMSLSATLPRSGTTLGPFSLTFGKVPVLRKCR